jgi:hypothetical protein
MFDAKIEGCFILPHVPHSSTSPYSIVQKFHNDGKNIQESQF